MNSAKLISNDKNTDEFIDKANGFIGNRIRDMNMKHRYFKLKEKVKNGKKDEKVCMTKKAFKKEHKNLLKVLKKKDPKKLDAEAKEQKKEMGEYGMQESIKTTGMHSVKLTPQKQRKTKGIQNFWSGSKAQAFRDNMINSDDEAIKNKQRRGVIRAAGGIDDNARFRRKQEKAKGMKRTKEQKKEMGEYGMQESIKTTGLKAVKLRKWDGVNDRPWVQDDDSARHRAFGANVVNAKGKKGDKQYARARRVQNDDRPENRDWNTNARFRREQEKAKGMKKVKESSSPLRAVKLVIRESNIKEKTAGEVDMQSTALKARIKNSSMPMHKKWNKLTKVASATVNSKKKATDEKRTSSAKAFKMLSDKLLKRKA